MMKIELNHVRYMPEELKSGILYVSNEFDIAIHICPCGCGSKIKTPLGTTEWILEETEYGPTLYPSIGNWQLPCQSHYWIKQGEVRWAKIWSPEQIIIGRRLEEKRRQAYYDSLYPQKNTIFQKFLTWLKTMFIK